MFRLKKMIKQTIKWSKRISVFFLALTVALPVCAKEPLKPEESGRTIHIATVKAFMSFAEECCLDSYSKGLTVYLDRDLDLSKEEDFFGVPIFCGEFNGGNHCISGLSLTGEGSVRGLFRYVEENALICDLQVKGLAEPQGTRCVTGGIAGSNRGIIRDCIFTGTVSGNENIGGIAGVNKVTGLIENCSVRGNLHGNHFVGGIAGKNEGLIRNCSNFSEVNVTERENDVDFSDITIEAMLGTEQANTVTDIAGIAGASTGVLRDCVNYGNIGYVHMGYNVGGIAGTQSGYITDCRNQGTVSGRKEVGGIVGQMEPILQVEYSQDALQTLRQQLSGTSSLIGHASANAMQHSVEMGGKFEEIQTLMQTAQDSVTQLIPTEKNPHLPEWDRVLAAQNTFAGSMGKIQETLQEMSAASRDAAEDSAQDIEAISDQLSAMGYTLNHAADKLGGSIEDVSDEDTPEDLTGKVENCRNTGAVSGDLNVGGITGAIGLEKDLDAEDDRLVFGERSLNVSGQMRGVILNCRNTAEVAGRKKNIGGIVGQMALGLVKESLNLGFLNAPEGSYVGGVTGTGSGYIRTCYAKCELSGDTYVGGIAGSGTCVTDCCSITDILEGNENLGTVLGGVEESPEEDRILNNFYLPIARGTGAIDGISYEGIAYPMERTEFFAQENLPEEFRTARVEFRFADGTRKAFGMTSGESLAYGDIPGLPERDGFIGKWKDMDRKDLRQIYFNRCYEAEYIPCYTTIVSRGKRENELPILFVEGNFEEEEHFSLQGCEEIPALEEKEELLECWKIPAPENSVREGLRICIPEGVETENIRIQVLQEDGTWTDREAVPDKSYLVFPIQQEDTAFCLIRVPSRPVWILWLGIGIAAAAVILIILICNKKKRLSKKRKNEET